MGTARPKDRQRFVVLSTCPEPWGGSEELWWEAACAIRRHGHEVEVLKTVLDDRHPRIRALRDLSCTVRELARTGLRRVWAGATVILPRRYMVDDRVGQLALAAHALTVRRPDMAIIAQGQNFDGAFLARLCSALRIPYVLISQKASDYIWPPDADRHYLRRVFQGARRTVFVSEHTRRLTEEQIGARLDNAIVVRNPVLAGGAGPLPWPDGDETRLACVGRLFVMEKGQDILLRVLAAPRWQARPVHVSFYGEGTNAEALAELAARLELKRIHFAGHAADMEAVWREHHALVLPSRAEGLPLAILEAMSCGRPAIVTDVGGNTELVEDGVTGFVAASPGTVALDDALERAWAHRLEWPEMGRAAAETINDLVPSTGSAALAPLLLADARGEIVAR